MPVAETRLECLQVLKLLQCVRQRDWTQVDKLIINGVPHLVNYTEPNEGEMALSVAAANDDLEMVEHLLKLGASANAVDSKGRTALMRAAERGHAACVEMIAVKADLTITDQEGKGLLFYCMVPTERHEKCADLAIKYGADVNNSSTKGRPLLVEACERANELERFCLMLIQSDVIDPNKEDERSKRTALMSAAAVGNKTIVKALLEKGANVNDMTHTRLEAVHEAAKGGHVNILQMLSGAGAQFDIFDDQNNTPMHLAARGRHAMCCKFLAQRGCNPKLKNREGHTARLLGTEEGSKSTVKECRRAERLFGKPPKTEAWAIKLYDFCCYRKEHLLSKFEKLDGDETGKLTRDDFVDILRETETPLPDKDDVINKLIAVHEKEQEVDYRLFLSGKKYITKQYRMSSFDKKKKKKKKKSRKKRGKKGKTKIPLPICTRPDGPRTEDSGPPEAFIPRHIRLTDPKRFDELHTPKHMLNNDCGWYCNRLEKTYINLNDAVRHSDMDTLDSSLRDAKEIVHWRDRFYKTPLMAAAMDGNLKLVKYFIENGADVNATDNFKWTALHLACKKGNFDVVELLIDAGAKLNMITLNGGSAIMRAIESGIPQVVQLLINHGADLRVETRKGKTPIDLAAAYGDARVYDIIKTKCDSLPPLPDKNKAGIKIKKQQTSRKD